MNNRTRIEQLALLRRAGVTTTNQEIALYCLEEAPGIRAAPLGRIIDTDPNTARLIVEGLLRTELASIVPVEREGAKPYKTFYITDKGRRLLRHISEAAERGMAA